jgi:hypothetical protein
VETDDKILTFAARLNALRIVPRALVIGYGCFVAIFAYDLFDWIRAYDFASLESEAVALAIVAFPTGVLGVMAGVLGGMVNNYFRTGGNGT